MRRKYSKQQQHQAAQRTPLKNMLKNTVAFVGARHLRARHNKQGYVWGHLRRRAYCTTIPAADAAVNKWPRPPPPERESMSSQRRRRRRRRYKWQSRQWKEFYRQRQHLGESHSDGGCKRALGVQGKAVKLLQVWNKLKDLNQDSSGSLQLVATS